MPAGLLEGILMDCPVCKNSPMIVLELDEVEVDYCLECNGIWLDAGELELLLEDESKAAELLRSFRVVKTSGEQIRKCPICLKKMQKVQVGQTDELLLIDRCAKKHGLWFDKGELQNVLKAGSLDEEQKIQKLLANMFGEKQKN
jgi:Zn-finger nucleic acid-binding protein